MKKILLSGFEPFGGASENPTRVLIKELERDFETLVLPVVFGEASRRLIKKIDEIQPDVVIALGQAEGRDAITPERIAINCDDARIPDNVGNLLRNQPIIEGGADGYFSTLPIDQMVTAINEVGVPARVSLSAGTFVCNNVFYALQHHLRGTKTLSGFIHVPLHDTQSFEFPGQPTMSLADMLKGIKAAISVL